MAGGQMRFSIIIDANASGVKPAAETAKREIGSIGEASTGTAAGIKTMTAANQQSFEASKRVTEQLRGQAAAERELAAAVAGFAGIRTPQNDNDFRARAADVDAYGSALDDLRAKFNPLFAIERAHKLQLGEIDAALKVGAISADEASAAVARANATFAAQNSVLRDIMPSGQQAAQGTALATHEITNLSYQMNDLVGGLLSGQSFGMIMAQQGGQVAQIMGKRGLGEVITGLATGMASLVTPTTMFLAGVTAAGYAGYAAYRMMVPEVKTLDEALDEHLKRLKDVEQTYEKLPNAVRGLGQASASVAAFRSQASMEQLRRSVAARTEWANIPTDLGASAETDTFNSAALVKGFPFALTRAEDMSPQLQPIYEKLFTGIRDGTPDVVAFNDELARVGQDPSITGGMRKRINEVIELTREIANAQRVLQDYDRNVGPTGLLRSASPFQTRDQADYDQWRIEDNANVRRIQRDAAVRQQEMLARSPAEKAAAARARAVLDVSDSDSGAVQRAKREAAEKLALAQAEHQLSEAQRQRGISLEQTIASAQLDLRLIGQTAGETARLRMEHELTAQARLAAAEANVDADEKELELIRQKAAEYGRLVEQQVRANALADVQFEREQLGRSDREASIAGRLRGMGLPVDLSSDIAQEMRLNEILKERKDLWRDIQDVGRDGIRSMVDGAIDGFDSFEDAAKNAVKSVSKLFGDLAITNPLTNAVYGRNDPTLASVGGIPGFFSALLGGKMPETATSAAAQSVGAMNVTAATVMINGSVVGGEGGPLGTLTKLLNPANANAAAPAAAPAASAAEVARTVAGQALGFVGNYKSGVDNRLTQILQEAAARFPGFKVDAISGLRPGDPRFHGQGLATDVSLTNLLTGQKLGNYQNASTFRTYEQFAQVARQVQMEKYPELADQFRWGGYFGGGRGKYGAVDTMHFDLAGKRVGMGGGSWEDGLNPAQRGLWPGAESFGMGKQANDAAQALDRLATSSTSAQQGVQKAAEGLGQLGTGFDTMGKNLANAFPAAPAGGGMAGFGGLGDFLRAFFMSPAAAMNIASGGTGLYAEGGWTGPGDKWAPKGIVHAEEFVFSSEATRAIGVQNLAKLHNAAKRGFAVGGYAGDYGSASGGAVQGGFAFAPAAQHSGTSQQASPIKRTVIFNDQTGRGVAMRAEETDDGQGGITETYYVEDRVGAAIGRPGSKANKTLRAMGFRPSRVSR